MRKRPGDRITTFCSLFVFTLLVGPSGFAQQDDRPNILYIMADDHASSAVGAYNGRYADLNPPPNIDRIAEWGMRLDNVMVTNSICVPSRATILSGEYSHEPGMPKFFGECDPEHKTLATLFKQAGYQTAIFGKWHLGKNPGRFGFQDYAVLPGQGKYKNPLLHTSTKGSWPNNKKTFSGHSSDVIGRLSLDWLSHRDPDKPFFLMVHFKSTHADWRPPERHNDLFADRTIPEPDTLVDTAHYTPAMQSADNWIENIFVRGHLHGYGGGDVKGNKRAEKRRYIYQRYMKQYLGCVRAIDDNVGRLQSHMDNASLTEETVLMYTSDQGHFQGEHGMYDKRFMYEPSQCMPFLVQYPPEIKPGSRSDELIVNPDFAPTMLDYAGQETPEYMQGVSFRPILNGHTPEDWREAAYYRYWGHRGHGHNGPAHYGIRTKRYKLIFFYGLPLGTPGASSNKTSPSWELYDLKKDPKEVNNVYNDPEYQDVVKKMTKKLIQKKKELGDTDKGRKQLKKRFHGTSHVDVDF